MPKESHLLLCSHLYVSLLLIHCIITSKVHLDHLKFGFGSGFFVVQFIKVGQWSVAENHFDFSLLAVTVCFPALTHWATYLENPLNFFSVLLPRYCPSAVRSKTKNPGSKPNLIWFKWTLETILWCISNNITQKLLTNSIRAHFGIDPNLTQNGPNRNFENWYLWNPTRESLLVWFIFY